MTRFTRPIAALMLASVAAIAAAAPVQAQDVAPLVRPDARTKPPTIDQIKARLAAAFAKYDEGGKGYLTEAELDTMMTQEQGGKTDAVKAKAAFADADNDADAQLSLDEFTDFVLAQLKAQMGHSEQRRGRLAGIVAGFDESWTRFDAGAKGYLTEAEFVAMMADIQAQASADRPADSKRPTPDAAKVEARSRSTFADADADKNGELTQDELKAHFAARMAAMRERRGNRGGGEAQGPGEGE